MWRPQYEALSKYCRVINVDIPGHGKSDKNNEKNPELVREWRGKYAGAYMPSMAAFMKVLCWRDSVVSRLYEITVPARIIMGQEDKALPRGVRRKFMMALLDQG